MEFEQCVWSFQSRYDLNVKPQAMTQKSHQREILDIKPE